MKNQFRILFLSAFLATLAGPFLSAQGVDVPEATIAELEAALSATSEAGLSAARKRLGVKRVIRDAGKILEEMKGAGNRYEVLGVLFRAQQQLFGWDDSTGNRAAVLETAKALAEAPDAYAGLRLEADLLLTQIDLARKGADDRGRLAALNAMVGRYRGTSGEAQMLRTAMIMALEIGDSRMIRDLRREMNERFAGDFEMINFQREKLGGQVFGAPFLGVFKRSDGGVLHLPADGLGQTIYLYFWSKGEDGRENLEGLANYWKSNRDEIAGRVQILSFNVDGLPDAGEKILRDLGVDWPALHLPGGRENPRYEIFAKRDGALVTVTPTGYAAIVMAGATRKRKGGGEATDFERVFQSMLSREWTREELTHQLTSIFVGDFLVADVSGEFDPRQPPEIKVFETGGASGGGAGAVPDEELSEIQKCFVLPPMRYQLTFEEIRRNYEKAERLCRESIASHPEASNLWVVRNRLIVALTGMWKLTMKDSHRDRAVKEAELVLAGEVPSGAKVIARLILARVALRREGVDHRKIIGDFVKESGGDKAPASALAGASLLALEVADRALHEQYRALILDRHREEPMMWTYVSFLLDRYHRYWLYRVPFTAGWTYGRRQGVFMAEGKPDEVTRNVEMEFETLDGKKVALPRRDEGKWSVIVFSAISDDPAKSPFYSTVGRYLLPYLEKRGLKDVQVTVAVTGGAVADLQAALKEKPLACEFLVVPGGTENPVMRELGVLEKEGGVNVVVLRPDGKVAIALSSLTMSRIKGNVVANVLEWHDRETIFKLLEQGDLEKAKEMIFALAPPFDPKAVDSRGRKLKKPQISLSHLRARARVYIAMEEWDLALADAGEVALEQLRLEGWMSLRTNQLDEDEAYLDWVKKKREEALR